MQDSRRSGRELEWPYGIATPTPEADRLRAGLGEPRLGWQRFWAEQSQDGVGGCWSQAGALGLQTKAVDLAVARGLRAGACGSPGVLPGYDHSRSSMKRARSPELISVRPSAVKITASSVGRASTKAIPSAGSITLTAVQ